MLLGIKPAMGYHDELTTMCAAIIENTVPMHCMEAGSLESGIGAEATTKIWRYAVASNMPIWSKIRTLRLSNTWTFFSEMQCAGIADLVVLLPWYEVYKDYLLIDNPVSAARCRAIAARGGGDWEFHIDATSLRMQNNFALKHKVYVGGILAHGMSDFGENQNLLTQRMKAVLGRGDAPISAQHNDMLAKVQLLFSYRLYTEYDGEIRLNDFELSLQHDKEAGAVYTEF